MPEEIIATLQYSIEYPLYYLDGGVKVKEYLSAEKGSLLSD